MRNRIPQYLCLGLVMGTAASCRRDEKVLVQDARTLNPISGIECEWFEGAGRFEHGSGKLRATLVTDSNGLIELRGVSASRLNHIVIEHPFYKQVMATLSSGEAEVVVFPDFSDTTMSTNWLVYTNSNSNGLFRITLPTK